MAPAPRSPPPRPRMTPTLPPPPHHHPSPRLLVQVVVRQLLDGQGALAEQPQRLDEVLGGMGAVRWGMGWMGVGCAGGRRTAKMRRWGWGACCWLQQRQRVWSGLGSTGRKSCDGLPAQHRAAQQLPARVAHLHLLHVGGDGGGGGGAQRKQVPNHLAHLAAGSGSRGRRRHRHTERATGKEAASPGHLLHRQGGCRAMQHKSSPAAEALWEVPAAGRKDFGRR